MTSSEYRMPRLPFGGAEATILRWLKRPGEQVTAAEPLLIAANDRVEVALPAGRDGVLMRQLVAEGAAAAAGMALAAFAPAANSPPSVQRVIGPSQRITPVARRIAKAHEFDPRSLIGTGVAGRVTKADLLAAFTPPRAEPPAGMNILLPLERTGERSDLAAYTRSVVGSLPAAGDQPGQDVRQAELKPYSETHALSAIEIDLGPVAAARARLSADFVRRGLALTDTVCVIAAVLAELPHHPFLNSMWVEEYIMLRRRIDLALIAGGRRVLVPNAQDLNLRGLARATRLGCVSTISDSTFTIVEYSDTTWCGIPALAARQSAALGIGAARARAAVVAEHAIERIAVRPIQLLVLAYDARVLDQCYADHFLHAVKDRLDHFGAESLLA